MEDIGIGKIENSKVTVSATPKEFMTDIRGGTHEYEPNTLLEVTDGWSTTAVELSMSEIDEVIAALEQAKIAMDAEPIINDYSNKNANATTGE